MKIKCIFYLFGHMWVNATLAQNTPDIFKGGQADGTAKATVTEPANNIFAGSSQDGSSTATIVQVSNNLFAGGNGDGEADSNVLQTTNNLFVGGTGDGEADANVLQSANNLFAGGNGDGEADAKVLQAGNNLFVGGIGDGWNQQAYTPSGPLPVSYLYFKVTAQSKSALVQWATVAEKNANYFEIQKGTNGIAFETVTKLAANQNSNSEKQYQWLDQNPKPGLNYYRLKQVDQDGKITLSAARVLNFKELEAIAKAYPVPANEYIYVELPKPGKGHLNLVNSLGIVVYHEKLNITHNKFNIPITQLPNGVYLLHSQVDTDQSVLKIVINHK